jgi:hypothetical protein
VTLPSVAILIPTYARVRWLRQALWCATHQRYAGTKAVLLLNDCPEQCLWVKSPQVLVRNWATPFPTLGDKRNALLAWAAQIGFEYVTWLDDDDLMLPTQVAHLQRQTATGTDLLGLSCWSLYGNKWVHAYQALESFVRPGPFLRAGGFPAVDVGEDQAGRARLVELGAKEAQERGHYVYCWDNGTWHISGRGVRDGACAEYHRDAAERLRSGQEPRDDVFVVPEPPTAARASAPDDVASLIGDSWGAHAVE